MKMHFKTKLLFSAASFSWLMVFLSWRFDHGLIIIADWAIFALILTSIYAVKKLRLKEMKYIANPERMR